MTTEPPPLVYVAGPMAGDPYGCVRQAIAAFEHLRDAGCTPILPQLSVLHEMIAPRHYEDWLTYDFDLITHAHAIARLPGESSGADREEAHATSLGIPVVHWPDDRRQWPQFADITAARARRR